MKSQEELYEAYEDEKFESLSWVVYHRDDIEEATGLRPPNSMPEAAEWMGRMKATLARKLNPDENNDEDDGDEGNDESSEEEQDSENDENNKAEGKED